MVISKELQSGIEKYYSEIKALGGFGARVSATMPNGKVRIGTLGQAAACQPTVTTDDGQRYVILGSLSDVQVVNGRRAELLSVVASMVGDDGTGDLGVIVDQALADDAEVTAQEVAEIVREAREEAAS